MTEYYKVLVNGRSCNGGDAEWSLPKQREDGTWEPGEWMPEISGPLALCANGYHLTREPARWWREGAECYVAEWEGEHVGDGGDKIAVRRCRLLRRLTAAELASLRVFVDGSHQVSDGIAWASGFARVEAHGSARVWAHGSARVWASDSAQVWASDSARVDARGFARVEARGSAQVDARDSARVWASGYAQVWAYDSATVEASDSAQVWVSDSTTVDARDSAQVWASDSATVEAHGSARVWASDSAQVWASDSATVWASGSAQVKARGFALVRTPQRAWGQPTVVTYDAAVWVDYRSGVPVVHTAEGRCEPVASGPCDQRGKDGDR